MSRAKTSKIIEIISISVTPFFREEQPPLTTGVVTHVFTLVNIIIRFSINSRCLDKSTKLFII